MVAEAMIEEIPLPIHAVFRGHKLLTVFNHCCHSRLAGKRKDGVQMIRHEQAQPAMARALLVVVLHCCQHSIADVGAAQLVLPSWHTVNGDEKPTAVGDPLRNCVWQLLANGKIHGSKCNQIASAIKYKNP